MTGDLLDLVLVLLAVAFGVSGFRQGFIIGVMSLAGFLGGGVLGAIYAPEIADRLVTGPSQEALVAIVTVFVGAVVGQFLASSLGTVVRDQVTWHPARLVDSFGGAVASVVSLLLISWLIGTAVANSPFPSLVYQVRHSQVLRSVDQVMPDAARTWFSSFRRLVDQNAFPQVFGDLGPERIADVPAPNRNVLDTAALRRASDSIVKIIGTAPSCSRRIEGSGFVYAPQHVMTNAHVVAGVRQGPRVITDDEEHSYEARVVLYDPHRDVAVLYVPGLRRSSLRFAGPAGPGDSAVVAGYPRNRSFTAVAARIRDSERATGLDIYQSAQVTREVYTLRARVEPGNSGGPLLSPKGGVYGVVFAAAVDDAETGYALTAREVIPDARAAAKATASVSTGGCD